MFQSSPSLLAGCNCEKRMRSGEMASFNPHPACWLGATYQCRKNFSVHVLFQSSPSLLAGCNLIKLVESGIEAMFQSSPSLLAGCNINPILINIHRFRVSILTQPVGWVQRVTIRRRRGINHGFNPHPACWLGATVQPGGVFPYPFPFQSSPSLLAGCNLIQTPC